MIVVVGHGSRVARSNEMFEEFVEGFRCHTGLSNVRVGYVELAQPTLTAALFKAAETAEEILVLPLFLLTAGHVKHDIPRAVEAVRRRYPAVRVKIAESLGIHPGIVQLVVRRLEQARERLREPCPHPSVLMIGRGCSDTNANGNFCKIVRLVEEAAAVERMAYGFIAVVRPTVPQAVDRLVREGPPAVILQPYLLFPGRLVEDLQSLVDRYRREYPGIQFVLSGTLGIEPVLFDVLQERLAELKRGDVDVAGEAATSTR